MATTQSSKRCSRRGIRIRGNLFVFKCREYVIAEELSIRDTFTQWRRQEIPRRTANKPRPELARAPGTCGSARRRVRGIATQGDGLEHWTEAPVHWCSHRFSHVLFVHSLLGKACFQEARTKMGKSSNTQSVEKYTARTGILNEDVGGNTPRGCFIPLSSRPNSSS